MIIHILHGPVHSGKTSSLIKYCRINENIAGILSPVINGKRHFLNIQTNEKILMESEENEEDPLIIGKYKFSSKAFAWANKILLESISKNYTIIIIDEIGPLELQGKGFAETLKFILKKNNSLPGLLLVIRENLVNEVLNYFSIKKENVQYFNKKML